MTLALILALALGCQAQSAQPPNTRINPGHVLKKAKPGVHWDQKSKLTADIDCDGITDFIYLGRSPGHVHVGLVRGSGEPPEVADTEVDKGTKDFFCGAPAKLTIESLDYNVAEPVGEPVEGFGRSETCKGLKLRGGDCDSLHFFWNHKIKHLQWWSM